MNTKPIICYPKEKLKNNNLSIYQEARKNLKAINEVIVPPRDAKCFKVQAGQFFRIENVEGPQVGDLNLFNLDNLDEKFYSGKTRALHGSHLSTGAQMWSCFPYLRPLATITKDTLDWYGIDEDGGSVHDVIGTRCDPYTAKLLAGNDYHYCCHSNLIRALAKEKNIKANEITKNLIETDHFYFVHSFMSLTDNKNDQLFFTKYYDVNVPAIIGRKNIYGFQFHPEKSGKSGLKLLQNFINL